LPVPRLLRRREPLPPAPRPMGPRCERQRALGEVAGRGDQPGQPDLALRPASPADPRGQLEDRPPGRSQPPGRRLLGDRRATTTSPALKKRPPNTVQEPLLSPGSGQARPPRG